MKAHIFFDLTFVWVKISKNTSEKWYLQPFSTYPYSSGSALVHLM